MSNKPSFAGSRSLVSSLPLSQRLTFICRGTLLRKGALFGTLLCAALAGGTAHAETVLVSQAPDGTFGFGGSSGDSFSLSADGTKVAFESNATNLVADDTNDSYDVFVRNVATGVTTRVSTDSNGNQANNVSYNPNISADGTKVVFYSYATNLVPNDTNNTADIFVKDLATGVTTRVSTDSNGNQSNSASQLGVLNADGSIVAFFSSASNLVSGDTNGQPDVFIKNLTTGVTTRVSTNSSGGQVNGFSGNVSLSNDGTKVAFDSDAPDLVPGDTNNAGDIFVKDLTTGVTTRVSTDANGLQGNSDSSSPRLSPDGTMVGFQGQASNLVPGDTNNTTDAFIKNLTTGAIILVGTSSAGVQGNSQNERPSISADNTKVAFHSYSNNLVPGDTNGTFDVFVKDLTTGVTTRISTSDSGVQGNSSSHSPSISADGTKVAYSSGATNLISDEATTYGQSHVYLWRPAVPLSLSINDVSKAEGNSGTTNAVFTVELSAASTTPTQVSYALANGTTDASDTGTLSDSDGGTPGTLTIAAGQTTGTITVPIKGDRLAEADETYTVNLSNAVGAGISDAQGAGTITNDDNAPTAISLTRTQVQEKLATNAFVAGISATDADAGETFTYSLPAGVGDNDAFAISGSQLRTAQTFDYAARNSYNITLQVTDGGGNTYQQPFVISILETTKPVATISSPTQAQKIALSNVNGNLIRGTATDNIGVTGVKVRLARKRNNINYYWTGSDWSTTQIYLDATISSVDVTSVGINSVGVNFMPNTTVTWALDAQLPPADKLDVGEYGVQVYAYDGAGNKSGYASTTFTTLPANDTTAPTLSIGSPTANQKIVIADFKGSAVSGTASDNTAVTAVKVRLSRKRGTTNYYWNGTSFGTVAASYVDATVNGNTWYLGANTPAAEKLDNGTYQVDAYALDAAGNKSTTSTASFNLSTDYTAPSVAISTPTSSQVININNLGAGTLTGTAGDNLGVVSVQLKLQRKRGTVTTYWNGTAFTTTSTLFDATFNSETGTWSYDSAIPASALDTGAYTLYATSYDAVGNKTTSASRPFSIVGTPSASDATSTASSANSS